MVNAVLSVWLAAVLLVQPAWVDDDCIGREKACPWTNDIDFYSIPGCLDCLLGQLTTPLFPDTIEINHRGRLA